MVPNCFVRSQRCERRAFTLLELIVVITIIGILSTVVVVKYSGVPDHARRTAALAVMRNVVDAAEMLHTTTGRYPESLEEMMHPPEGTRPLVKLEEMKEDPWGHPYQYSLIDGEPQIICLGRDGVEGGEDYDADLILPAPQPAHSRRSGAA